MEFFDRARNTSLAFRNKLRFVRHSKFVIQNHIAQRQQRHLHRWIQERKHAAERMRTMSSGHLEFIENGYRGNHRRHLLMDTRCGHIFCASLRELARETAEHACPFCYPVHHLRRYGSVPAVQAFVLERTDNKIIFAASNHLGHRDDDYTFGCSIHRIQFEVSFAYFIDKTAAGKDFCPLCSSPRS